MSELNWSSDDEWTTTSLVLLATANTENNTGSSVEETRAVSRTSETTDTLLATTTIVLTPSTEDETTTRELNTNMIPGEATITAITETTTVDTTTTISTTNSADTIILLAAITTEGATNTNETATTNAENTTTDFATTNVPVTLMTDLKTTTTEATESTSAMISAEAARIQNSTKEATDNTKTANTTAQNKTNKAAIAMTTAETISQDDIDTTQDISTKVVEMDTVSVITITDSANTITDTTSTACAMITTEANTTQSSTVTAETRTNNKAESCTIKATITTDEEISSAAAFTTEEAITMVEAPSMANAMKTAGTNTPAAPTNEELTANTEVAITTTLDTTTETAMANSAVNTTGESTVTEEASSMEITMTSQEATTTQSGSFALGLHYQRKTKRRRKKVKKLKQCVPHSMDWHIDSESSDDNIPLKQFQRKHDQKRATEEIGSELESIYESGDSFKPSKHDYNSSDSNLSTPTDDSAKRIDRFLSEKTETKAKRKKNQKDRQSKKINSKSDKNKRKPTLTPNENQLNGKGNSLNEKNNSNANNQEKIGTTKDNTTVSSEDIDLRRVMEISEQVATFNELATVHHEQRLDDLLFVNGLQRKPVSADGNCFFQSALPHIPNTYSVQSLRRTLCDHIIDNAKEYVGFFAVSDLSESFDEDISSIDFRTEIDELSVNGKWTNRAADLLPLALANWTGQTVKIFSSLSNQTILDITPSVKHSKNSSCEPITLAYLASTNNTIPEHYDACVKLGTAHKPSNANQLNQSDSCHEESEITENINREISNEEGPSIDNNHQSENSDVLYTCVQIGTPEKPKRKRGRPKGTPPRKAPNFITPPKKKLFRKRKAMPETWKKKYQEKTQSFGQRVYIREGQHHQGENAFWSLENNERKKDFIVTNTIQKKTRTYIDEGNELVKKKRNVHRSYSFKLDGEQITVCKKIFLMTLGISESFAEHALQNQLGGVFVGKDKRGKHEPHNKTPKNALEMVRKHIKSFPVVEGHYTRKDSNRKYLGADLNITRMYQLYLEHYKEELPEKEIVSQAVYRKEFSEEYNFSFHVPKKISVHFTNHPSIDTIDHKFLESGHTQMECDSMHSAIEFAKKKTEIYVPQQWATMVRMARRKDPYMVVPLKFRDIYNFKELTKKTMKYRKDDITGEKVNWLHIKWLRYTKAYPDSIQFKNDFDKDFRILKVSATSKRGRQTGDNVLPKKYTSRQQISAAKKKDLVSLCKKGIIPSEYHDFYKSLPSNSNIEDTLAETDVEEEKSDSEQE
ncbi:unnamed protein product [Mytilus coruscus]|uniref:OTU domain-containing protein n=1 Tax=Mytilus coruscus TaxID=42192 RepID=A0A6J8AFU0_MYTCO|nr:unnamed protein product [Mytilus coruscus]